MISYEIEKDNYIIRWLSKESKPRPRFRLKSDNHIVNTSRLNTLRRTYLVLILDKSLAGQSALS